MQKLSSVRRINTAKVLFAAALVGLSGPNAMGQPTIRSVGAMQDVNKVSVRFNGPIDSNSIATVNFAVSGATVTNAEMQLNHSVMSNYDTVTMTSFVTPQINDAVLLSLSAPITGAHTLNVSGVKDLGGTTMAPVTGQAFTVSGYKFGQMGKPFYIGSAAPYGADGFDIENYGGGLSQYLDEDSFVYVKRTNDFDFKMHIVSYAYSGRNVNWGIIARESIAEVEGVPYYSDPPANTTRNLYPRCINVYAWPVKLIQYDDGVHWTVLDARIRYDAVYRSIFGGNFGTGNAPQYPFAIDGGRWNENRPAPVWPNNVWLRLRRIGNTFYGYHSSDGINWGVNNGPGSDFVTHPYIMEGCSNVMYVGFQNADSRLDTTGIATPWFDPADGVSPLEPEKWAAYHARGFHAFFDNAVEIPWPTVSIVVQPTPASVFPNNQVTFTVAATGGDLPLTYQWYKGPNPIGGATASSYNIPSVQPGDAGNYKVVVSNGKSELTSTEVALVV